MGGARRQARLNVSIDYPNFRLRLRDADARHLADVRRIIEAIGGDEPSLDDLPMLELRSRLSEEFFNHAELLDRVKSSLVLEEDLRILKRVLPVEREVDLDTGRESVQLTAVKGSVAQLFDGLDLPKVRECLVHIRGDLSREQQVVVMDAIRQRFGLVTSPRFFSTRKNLEGNVLIEAVCFGQGIAGE